MPNDLDNFSLYVLVRLSGSLSVSPNDVTVDSGAEAQYSFMFKPGKPFATGFSVAWFSDSSRTQAASSAPSSPRFSPATPGALQAAVDNPRIFHAGNMRVTAPTLPQGEQNDPPVVYYGRMTLHQA